MRRVTTICTVLAALVAAGCGDDDGAETSTAGTSSANQQATTPTTEEVEAAAKPGSKVTVRSSPFGRMLWDSKNRALYLFTLDKSKRSRCYGECAKAWPPFYTKGPPRAGKGVEASELGTTKRRDGRLQVTYNGHPLYYYVDDPKGQVLCHDVVEFGGTWLVVGPGGNALRS